MSSTKDFLEREASIIVPIEQTHALSDDERREIGREARRRLPVEEHAHWAPASDRSDPVEMLNASSEGRIPELIRLRNGRMLADAFAFYRGSAGIMAADLANLPNSGLQVQACGDAHLLNFGGFATPERNIIFDINDFDETSIAPWEWDVKRLAASLVIAGRANGFAPEDSRRAAWRVADAYQQRMAAISRMSVLDAWYESMDLDEILDNAEDEKIVRFYRKKLKKAAKRSDHEKQFAKLAFKEGRPARIMDQPPLIYHTGDVRDDEFMASVIESFRAYKASLNSELHLLLDRYTIADVARKVVGVGSVGTLCGIVLLMSAGEPLFLQFKEAGESVLEPYAGKSRYAHPGHRVVSGQRLMQAATDMFLGWTDSTLFDRPIYVRQLRDVKIKPVVTVMKPLNLHNYAVLCAQALANAHSRSGDALALAAYMGEDDRFANAIANFGVAYADQNDRDYEVMVAAVRDGRIEVQTEE